MPEMNTRNLPFYAGTAVAYGLEYEQGGARFDPVDGKDSGHRRHLRLFGARQGCHLVYLRWRRLGHDGQRCGHAWIQGRDVVLDNKQIQLYEKYKAKYDAQRARRGR